MQSFSCRRSAVLLVQTKCSPSRGRNAVLLVQTRSLLLCDKTGVGLMVAAVLMINYFLYSVPTCAGVGIRHAALCGGAWDAPGPKRTSAAAAANAVRRQPAGAPMRRSACNGDR
eukprot:1670973-Pleurochrysis_carterae.AAC.1